MPFSVCTWIGCDRIAPYEHKAKDGSIWATLCYEHNCELELALESKEPKKLLSSWVKAQGGPQKAAARM